MLEESSIMPFVTMLSRIFCHVPMCYDLQEFSSSMHLLRIIPVETYA
jgi:hypothetical protein